MNVNTDKDTIISWEELLEINNERKRIHNKILLIKEEINSNRNNIIENEEDYVEQKKYLYRLENLKDSDILKIVQWKNNNQIDNVQLHKAVLEAERKDIQKKNIPQNGELFSFNETHPVFFIGDNKVIKQTSIQPAGSLEHNIQTIAKLKNLSEAKNVNTKIHSAGYDCLSTNSRVILFNQNEYFDFNTYGEFNNFNNDIKLNDWDFIDFIKNDYKITKRMKQFSLCKTIEHKSSLDLTAEPKTLLHVMKPEALVKYDGLPPFIKIEPGKYKVRVLNDDMKKQVSTERTADLILTEKQLRDSVVMYIQKESKLHGNGNVTLPAADLSDLQKELYSSMGINEEHMYLIKQKDFDSLLCQGKNAVLKVKEPEKKQEEPAIHIKKDVGFDLDY